MSNTNKAQRYKLTQIIYPVVDDPSGRKYHKRVTFVIDHGLTWQEAKEKRNNNRNLEIVPERMVDDEEDYNDGFSEFLYSGKQIE